MFSLGKGAMWCIVYLHLFPRPTMLRQLLALSQCRRQCYLVLLLVSLQIQPAPRQTNPKINSKICSTHIGISPSLLYRSFTSSSDDEETLGAFSDLLGIFLLSPDLNGGISARVLIHFFWNTIIKLIKHATREGGAEMNWRKNIDWLFDCMY